MTDAINEYDASGMLEKVKALPDQLEEAMDLTRDISVSDGLSGRHFHSIALCGMGGSAISGDIVAALLSEDLSEPMNVVRDYSLPKCVGESTLLFLVSYSGNTEETISCLLEGMRRKAGIFCISSGGRLRDICRENELDYVSIPPGWPPRTAVGHLVVPILDVLHRMGLSALDPKEFVPGMVCLLREVRGKYLDATEPADAALKQIAGKAADSMLMVYAPPELGAAARRWMCQVNENGKALAHWGCIPEMNHNELVGWGDDSLSNDYLAVFLTHDGMDRRVYRRISLSMDMIGNRGVPTVEVRVPGADRRNALFAALYMGDILSVFLAGARRIDPTPVMVIDHLKNALADPDH